MAEEGQGLGRRGVTEAEQEIEGMLVRESIIRQATGENNEYEEGNSPTKINNRRVEIKKKETSKGREGGVGGWEITNMYKQ